jgi:hypothetical protein
LQPKLQLNSILIQGLRIQDLDCFECNDRLALLALAGTNLTLTGLSIRNLMRRSVNQTYATSFTVLSLGLYVSQAQTNSISNLVRDSIFEDL